MRFLRIALAQVNTSVGDIHGNANLIIEGMAKAQAAGAELVKTRNHILGTNAEEALLPWSRGLR